VYFFFLSATIPSLVCEEVVRPGASEDETSAAESLLPCIHFRHKV